MKRKSIIIAVCFFALFTVSMLASAEEPQSATVKAVTIEWVESGAGGKTHSETIYCAANCDAVIAKRIAEIKQAGGVIIDDGSGK